MPTRRLSLWLASVLLASIPAGLPAQVAPTAWPLFRQNAQRTGVSPLQGPERPVRLWQADLGARAYSSPAVGEGETLYVGSATAVYAVRNGERLWAAPLRGYAISSPALAATGQLYVGSRDGALYAFRQSDGQPARAPLYRDDDEEVWSSPAIGPDGAVYFGTSEGVLYAFEPTGALRWSYPTGEEIGASPALAPNGTVYIGTLGGQLYAIGPDGAERWVVDVDSSGIVATPAVGPGGEVVVGALDGTVYAFEADGQERWPFATQDTVASSAAILPDGTAIVGSFDGNVYAIAPDGQERWDFDAGDRVVASPAVDADGVIYVGTLGGRLYAIGPDGVERWRLQLDSPIWASPAIGTDRRLYVVTTGTDRAGGQLYAIGSAAFVVEVEDVPRAGAPVRVLVREATFTPEVATLFYRQGGALDYTSVEMTDVGSGQYQATIPADSITIRGVGYYVRLAQGDQEATVPPVDPEESPASLRVRVGPQEAPVALAPRRYRLVSVPYELDEPQPLSVFEDDLGAYTPERWRLLYWDGERYVEPPGLPALAPGRSLLLATTLGGSFTAGEGLTADTAQPFLVELQPGWNHAANPFAFPVAWADVERDPSQVTAVASFEEGAWRLDPGRLDTLRLQPWSGVLVYNRGSEATSIRIPPVESGVGPPNESVQISPRPPSFQLQLQALAGAERDGQNWVGWADGALGGDDPYDLPEVPALAKGVRLSILDAGRAYARSIQPRPTEGARWTVEVERPGGGDVTVRLVPEGDLPAGFAVAVLDGERGVRLPADDGRLRLRVGAGSPRRLVVVVGTEAYLDAAYPSVGEAAAAFALYAGAPNPFHEQTEITYSVGARGAVRIDVFNAIGQRVRTLVDAVQEPDTYTLRWDGTDDGGGRLASGVYLCRLSAGRFQATQSLLLMR